LYALVTSIPLMVPFLDFGMGANLLLAASEKPFDARLVRSVFLTCSRWLLLIGALATTTGLVISLTDSWPSLLGNVANQPGIGWAMFACVALLGVFLPFNLGARLLLAQGRMHVTLWLQAAAAVATLLLVLVLSRRSVPLVSYSVAFYASLAAATVVGLAIGLKATPERALGPPLTRDLVAMRRLPMVPVVATSVAMFIQMFASAVGLHADRLILSHRMGAQAVAAYFLAAQVFLALMSVVSSAGMPLWPRYHSAPESARPMRDAARLSMFGLGLSLVGAAVTPLICWFVTGDPGYVAWQVYAAWMALLTVTGAVYPLGLFTQNHQGLRRQAPFQFGYLVANVGLTFALIPSLGVAGPVAASALSSLVMQVIPFGYLARRRMAELRLAADDTVADAPDERHLTV
jgi:O-antigen/teichoic acid export membrane protein